MYKRILRQIQPLGRFSLILPIALFLMLLTLGPKNIALSQDEPEAQAPVTLFFPIVSKAHVAVSNVNATRGGQIGENYGLNLTWSIENAESDTSYTITESTSPSMNPVVNTYTSNSNSANIEISPSTDNVRYFTVQSSDEGAPASDPIRVVGPYRDDFNTNSGWEIRRQDFDDTENVMSYVDGNLKMHVRGRWDYFITSPLAEAPAPPYRIRTRVKLEGPGNLNTYGIIFGGDHNGGACPTIFPPTSNLSSDRIQTNKEIDILPTGVRAPDAALNVVDNCLNQYYRVIFLWKDGFSHMHGLVKQINFHDDNNSGRGDAISPSSPLELRVSSGSANDWNDWAVEVYPDGVLKILSGNNVVYNVQTTGDLVNQPIFGLWASTDEYPGSDPLWDYILVEPID